MIKNTMVQYPALKSFQLSIIEAHNHISPNLVLYLDYIKGLIMNLATDIKPISYLKLKTADAISYANKSHNPLIITQNSETKAVIQDIKSYQNMQNAIAMLKLLAEGESDIQNSCYESQESFCKNRASFKQIHHHKTLQHKIIKNKARLHKFFISY